WRERRSWCRGRPETRATALSARAARRSSFYNVWSASGWLERSASGLGGQTERRRVTGQQQPVGRGPVRQASRGARPGQGQELEQVDGRAEREPCRPRPRLRPAAPDEAPQGRAVDQ